MTKSLRATIATPGGKAPYVRRLFATIADRYDLITVLLSYGQDRRWKRRLLEMAEPLEGLRLIDLACGTGDIAVAAAARGAVVTGLDLTPRMIQLARDKAGAGGTSGSVSFVVGDMMTLPFASGSCDVVTTGYGLRNVPALAPAVQEIGRVLKPGGRVGVSDVVAEDRLSPRERAERGSYVGCIAGALSKSEYEVGLEAAGFEDVAVEFTHEVADRIHGAIIRAVKTTDPTAKGLPVVQPAARAGCC